MTDFNRRELRARIVRDADRALAARDLPLFEAVRAEADAHGLLDEVALISARLAWTASDFDKALKYVAEALELNPTLYAGHVWRVFLLNESKSYEAGIKAANESIEALSMFGTAALYNYKSLAYEGLGKRAEARSCYLRAIEEDEKYFAAYQSLLRLGLERQDWEEIVDVAVRMVEKFKEQPDVSNTIGVLVLTTAESALKADRTDIDGRLTDIARQQFESLVQREPGNSAALYNLACSYGRTGNALLAVEYLRRALEAISDNQERSRLLGRAAEDPDFAKIRGESVFQSAIAA